MTTTEYNRIIAQLGFSQEAAGEWLGYTGRHGQRFARGENKIPKAVAMLLRVMMRYNLTIDDVEKGA